MFSITVEEVFEIGSRKGITLIGKTSGLIRVGDYLVDVDNGIKHYEVIGVEMVHYINPEKNLIYNPAIMIEQDNYEPSHFKGKTLESQSV